MQGQFDVFTNDLPMPELPPKRAFQAPAPGVPTPSSAPNPSEAVLASQPPAQRQRLEADLQLAREMEAQQAKVRRPAHVGCGIWDGSFEEGMQSSKNVFVCT